MSEPRITPEQVRNVARLARLATDEQELARLGSQIESILEYVAKVDQADVSGIEPMSHAASLTNVFREDEAKPGLSLEQVLQNAPQTDGPFFKVPKIIGGDEDSAG